ncbi:hypothetical protein HID58_041514 [Brassica napus]|uniref:S-locus receptor kinase C-terminal domain-containing protein n=3 Tax=Brassica TaxID=3705 RepID=A0ABQ8BB26_BRANA|nr:hypothetical protein HID58_041514 [Brassica napus]
MLLLTKHFKNIGSDYMSPEYAMYGQFSIFGVLVLQIISGKKNSSLYQMDGNAESSKSMSTSISSPPRRTFLASQKRSKGTSTVEEERPTWRLWSNGSQLELMDASFRENYQTDEVTKCIHIALLCVQEEAEDRPTMQDIDQMLTTSSIALTLPRPPGFFFRSKHEQVGGVHPYMDSVDESSITQVAPR